MSERIGQTGYEAGVDFWEKKLCESGERYQQSSGDFEILTNLEDFEDATLKLAQLERREKWRLRALKS